MRGVASCVKRDGLFKVVMFIISTVRIDKAIWSSMLSMLFWWIFGEYVSHQSDQAICQWQPVVLIIKETLLNYANIKQIYNKMHNTKHLLWLLDSSEVSCTTWNASTAHIVSNNKKKVSLVIKQDYKKNMFCFISYQADRKKNTGTVTAVQII